MSKMFLDIADHENAPAFQQAGISIHKYSRSIFFYLAFHQLHPIDCFRIYILFAFDIICIANCSFRKSSVTDGEASAKPEVGPAPFSSIRYDRRSFYSTFPP